MRFGWLTLAIPVVGLGCSYLGHSMSERDDLAPTRVVVASPAAPIVVKPTTVAHSEVPPPASETIRQVHFRETPGAVDAVSNPPPQILIVPDVGVDLDSLLKMTEEKNLTIALARKRVEDACDPESMPSCCLLSGIFGEKRRELEARARHWQRAAELARTRNETLLDAGNTYIDLLTARRGELVGHELEKYLETLLKRSEDLAKGDRSATVLVESIRGGLNGTRGALAKLHQQGDAATTKLVYLLNLPPETPVHPRDLAFEPMDRVDVSTPSADLIAQSQANGPGVHEIQGLIQTIQQGIDSVRPCLTHLPKVAEQLTTAHHKLEEANLALLDLRGKLAAGVVEARSAIVSGREQITSGSEQIRHAAETYRLSDLRLKENAPGASPMEVLQSIRGLEQAHFAHISAVAGYNKAQLRLQLLLGAGADEKKSH